MPDANINPQGSGVIIMMQSLFAGITHYGSWTVRASYPVSDADKKAIKSAEIVASNFGKSVCFTMISGAQCFIPVANDCRPAIGQKVSPDDMEVVELEKPGEGIIKRVRIKEPVATEEATAEKA